MPSLQGFHQLTYDGWILFGTRTARLFAYGLYSVALVFFLKELDFPESEIGLLIMLTLVGDTCISLLLTTTADRLGRRKMLLIGALLMIFAGVVFAVSSHFWLLLVAATVGVISPSGNEVGPFLPIEQAALAHTSPAEERTGIFAWYNLAGSLATAAGALAGGYLTQLASLFDLAGADRYRPLAIVYGVVGVCMAVAFTRLSPAVEAAVSVERSSEARPHTHLGLHHSLPVVLKLAALFALDAFGGGFVIQSVMAYWFYVRFQVEPELLGGIFFGANVLAGYSALIAARVARRIGLLNTMVLTHLPSNVLLILVPLMPNVWLAVLVLWLRFSISQMDVPTRQSYTMAVVRPEERSAAAGVTGVARSIGASLSPMLATIFVGSAALTSLPFFLGGGIKILYDLLLYRSFLTLRPPEENASESAPGSVQK